MSFTFIDLFAGIGGFRLAAEAAGGTCVLSSEIDKWARQTYAANYGEEPAGDIRAIDPTTLGHVDLICAGFPCQPFSNAGVSKNLSLGRASGFEDKTRGTLFFEVCRFIEATTPAVVVLENVANLVHHDKGRTIAVIMETLDDLGYRPEFRVLNAADYGTPQHRRRTFIVARSLRQTDAWRGPFAWPATTHGLEEHVSLYEVLDDDVPAKYTLSDSNWACRVRHLTESRAKGNGFGHEAVNIHRPAPTLLARYYKDGGECLVPQDGANPRRLTPREMARCFGYPESFKIVCSDTQAYKQFGNSVAIPVVTALIRQAAKEIR